MISSYTDAIRTFEGFAPQAKWDYAQFTNGYGTRARYAGEVIDATEADRRFQAEVAKAREIVDRHAPRLDEGTKAALTSLTYNAGDTWVRSGLGEAVLRGDLDQVRSIFKEYNKAGGDVHPGLVSRRAAEALWIGNPEMVGGATLPSVAASVPEAEAVPMPEKSEDFKVAAASVLASDASARLDMLAAALFRSSGEARLASDLLAVSSAGGGETGQISPLTTSSFSEIARLMKLDNGHELLAAGNDANEERERRRTA